APAATTPMPVIATRVICKAAGPAGPSAFCLLPSAFSSRSPERDRHVASPEAERVRQRGLHRHRARRVRDVIEGAIARRIAQTEGRWRELMCERQNGDHRLDRARRAERMTKIRLA